MINVLYAGAANLGQPSSGMDLGSRCHFEEISDDPQLSVTAISVCPSPFDRRIPPRRPAQMFQGDMTTATSARQRLTQKLGLLARGGILFQAGYKSDAARMALDTQLAAEPDVLFIDHIAALANIPLLRLLRLRLHGRTKIMMIAHDISSGFLHDRAKTTPSKLKALAIHLHALHCHLYENVVYILAHRVFFVSTNDRDSFRYVRLSKTDAMCQIIEVPTDGSGSAPSNSFGRYLLFVGSPSFFPNAFAIDWIIQCFAPALLARKSDLRLLLVGKGTDQPDPNRPANVTGLGFVDDERLHQLLHGSCGALSPIIHGAGIKIKVLEAIAAGCAIFATEYSMRGYEFMQLEPLLDVDDPAASADRVCAIADNPVRLAGYQQQIETRWRQYKGLRRGRLAAIVKNLVATSKQSSKIVEKT